MPGVVAEVLRVTGDPDVAVGEVSSVIERDSALTAKLLKVSNSPYYGMNQVVGTLKLALVILGVREVRNIVLGISVVDSLKDSSTERLLDQLDFWDHSVKVAGFAKKLGTHLRLNLQGEDFIASRLHDIGKMVLWR
jgi:HD-like signal output (HDOD) protein